MTVVARGSNSSGDKLIEFIRSSSPSTVQARIYFGNEEEQRLVAQIAGAHILVSNAGNSRKACLKAEQMGEEPPEEPLCRLSAARQNAIFQSLSKYEIKLIPGDYNDIIGIQMIR